MPVGVAGTAGMDADLPHRRSQTDGDIFDCAAVTGHGMSLEVGKDHIGIIIFKMGTYQIALETFTVFDREFHGTVLVQNLKIRDFGITPVFRYLIVFGGRGTGTAVGGVALNDRGIQFLYQVLDQLRTQIIGFFRFSGRNLDRNIFARFPTQCLVNRHQSLR